MTVRDLPTLIATAMLDSTPVINFYPDNYPYSIKRDGLTLINCDSEPVRTPGCVQSHGVILVLRLVDLSILQASSNAETVLQQSASTLLGKPVSAVIGLEGERQLWVLINKQSIDRNPAYLLTLPANHCGSVALDITVHTIDGNVIVELEGTDHTAVVTLDHYAALKKTVAKLQTAGSLQQFCNTAADEIRELTGLDRVMIHKFHADGHGEVYAESKRNDLSSWVGQHYLAEEVPKPTRDLFKKTWLRPVPDVSDALAELHPLVNPETGIPLDMTYCAIRGVSLMYSEYLRNMNVTAALTMAIRHNDELWGLVTCHHYEGVKHLSYQVRAACELLAQVVSLQHQAAEEKDHFAYRLKLENTHQQLLTVAAKKGSLEAMIDNTPSLLDGIDAGGVALYYYDRWWCVGNTPTESELITLGAWLSQSQFAAGSNLVYATDNLIKDYPPASAFTKVASGLLALPLSLNTGHLVVWFRPETLQTIDWRGNPDDKTIATGPYGSRLTPRRSFELFTKSVHQRAIAWKTLEIEAATRLRLLMIELVIDRTEQLTILNNDLKRSNEQLDSFAYVASHDLKEPLRGIHKYAYQLLEDAALGNESHRHKLDGLIRLTLRMDSLLDSLLYFSRISQSDLLIQNIDLNDLLAEAIEMVGSRICSHPPEFVVARLLPVVPCNAVWIRQIFVNLLSNALKYTDQINKRVEIGHINASESHTRPGCPEGSSEHTIFYVADNGIGIQERHFAQVFKLFKRLHGSNEYGGGTGAGLNIVRKLIERHHGKVWIDSILGKGTTFYFTLPHKGVDYVD